MTKIFISYSRKDELFARRLTTSLCLLGADVWIDLEDIPLGVKWSTAIQEGLNESEVMIIILSPDSMASSNVEDEWQYFLDQKKPVVPVLFRNCNIHFQLNRLQRVHFDGRDYNAAFEELHTELQQRGFEFEHTLEYVRDHTLSKRSFSLPGKANQRRSRLAVGGAVVLVALVAAIILMLVSNQSNQRSLQVTNTAMAAIVAALSATATESLIVVNAPTASPTLQPSDTSAPTEPPTAQPSDTPVPTDTAAPQATNTPQPSDTPAPTEAVIVVSETAEPNLMLVYDEDGLVLLNRSSRTISIANLLFVQRLESGTTLSFDGSTWTDSARSFVLASGACAQVSKAGARAPVLPSDCRSRFAWAQVSDRRWFWISSSRNASFEVRQGDAVLATCSIQAGRCGLQTGS